MSWVEARVHHGPGRRSVGAFATRSWRRDLMKVAPLYLAGLLVAFALKVDYSIAGADRLQWVLAPTCRLAQLLSGIVFEKESGTGWISRSGGMIVGPACAGLNFLIIVFCMLFFSFAHRIRGGAARAAWMAASLSLAYLLTLGTNSLRIILAIQLRRAPIYGSFVTASRVHRMEGILIYSLSMILTYFLVERSLDRVLPPYGERPRASLWVPLAWYLAIALGVPLAGRAYRHDPARFAEHASFVLSTCAALALVGLLIRIATHRSENGAPPKEAGGGARC